MSRSCLIIFARYPVPGKVKTRLGEKIGMAEAAAIYDAFAQHTFGIGEDIRQKGVDVHLFFDHDASVEEVREWVGKPFVYASQVGGSLGERMLDAFEAAFREGPARTVIIGTDVPELGAATVEASFQLLGTHDIVVGPSADGGYYLLGMNRPVAELFRGIRWGTGEVLSETVRRAGALGLSLSMLDLLSDIDTLEDYVSYLRRRVKS
jgi:rSAM/selenodomain-associated transferase 1